MPYYLKKTGSALDPNKVMYYVGEERWSDNYSDHLSFVSTSAAQQVKDAARVATKLKTATISEEE